MLWGSQLKLLKKIAATIVLGAGVFVLVCATLKSAFVLVVSPVSQPCTHNLHRSLTVNFRTQSTAPNSPANGARARPSSQQ